MIELVSSSRLPLTSSCIRPNTGGGDSMGGDDSPAVWSATPVSGVSARHAPMRARGRLPALPRMDVGRRALATAGVGVLLGAGAGPARADAPLPPIVGAEL